MAKKVPNVSDLKKYIEVRRFIKASEKTELWPDNESESRRMAGMFTRLLGKPTIRKWGETDLEASFELDGHRFVVNRYKTKNCRLVTKKVLIPATPAVEARPERWEERQVLECKTEIVGE